MKKLKKKPVLITNDVIEECLCESLDVLEKNIVTIRKHIAKPKKSFN
jgi:hypothetical protein